MSGPTSIGDLLDLATDHIDAVASAAGPDPLAVASAWPPILSSSRRAMRTLEITGSRTPTASAVHRLLVRTTDTPARQAAAEYPGHDLHRTGVLLGAVTDLLASAPRPTTPEREAAARGIAGIFAAAATVTAHTTIYDPRSLDTALSATIAAREAHRVIAVEPRGRAGGVLDDVATTSRPVAAPADLAGHLDVAVHDWRSAAIAAARRPDASSDDLRATARTATQLLALALTLTRAPPPVPGGSDRSEAVGRAITAAGQRWTAASHLWRTISTGTPASGDLVAAARAVRVSIDALARSDGRWLDPPQLAERAALARSLSSARRAVSAAADVAQAHADAVQHLGRSEHLYIPATRVHPDTPERLHARLHRRWVPVTGDEFPLLHARTGAGYDPALATSTRNAAVAATYAASSATGHASPEVSPRAGGLSAPRRLVAARRTTMAPRK